MSPQSATRERPRERKTVGSVQDHTDEQAQVHAQLGGDSLETIIDENSLKAQIDRAAGQNRAQARPFRQYQKRVIEKADVANTHQTRQMTSNICGAVARLPFVPDSEIKITGPDGKETTEFEQQIVLTARQAEEMLGSEMVWTVSAQKLARAALELRAEDPDGSKGIAWVNDMREDEAYVLDE